MIEKCRSGMQDGGGEAAAPPVNVGPTKRMRRPSVRLHQPYYENPGHRKLRQQWKKDFTGAKKPRTVRTVNSKNNKNDCVSDSSKGEEMEDFNFDDDVAIGNWKNFNVANRDGDSKRKRFGPPSLKKWVSGKSRKNGDLEIENFPSSSGGESEKHEQKEQEDGDEEEEQEKNLGANGNNSNLVRKDFDPSRPNCSIGDDDGNDKWSDDNDNVGGNQGEKQRGLSNGRNLNEMGGKVRNSEGDRDRDGVRMWLKKLGLGKYASLFEVHGVDDEVLPFLTLEDLKDMGINEVGPRRKMYCSIQKLSKGLL